MFKKGLWLTEHSQIPFFDINFDGSEVKEPVKGLYKRIAIVPECEFKKSIKKISR